MHAGGCFECPVGSVCATPGSTLADLNILPGYFRFTQSSTEAYECPKSLNCVGGNVTGTKLCSNQASGLMCSVCRSGYYVRDAIAVCTPCGNVNDLWWLGPAIVLIVAGFGAGVVHIKRTHIKIWLDKNSDWLKASSKDLSARGVAVFVNMQVIVLIQSNHNELGGSRTPTVIFPTPLPCSFLYYFSSSGGTSLPNASYNLFSSYQPYREFVEALKTLSLDLIQMMPADCMVESSWSYYDSLLLETLAPLVLLGCIFLFHWTQRKRSKAPQENLVRHIGIFIKVMLLFFLPSISRRICQAFQCRSFDGGDFSLLVADYSISCLSNKHTGFVYFAIIMLLIYPIGYPCLTYIWLRKFEEKLDNRRVEEQTWTCERLERFPELENHPIASFGLHFRPRYWYFDLVSLFRRLMLTSFVLIFESPEHMLIFVFFTSIFMLVIEREAQPYLRPETSMAVYILQWQVVLFIQGLLLIDANLTDGAGEMTIGLALSGLNVLLVGVIGIGGRETMKRASLTMRRVGREASTRLGSQVSRRLSLGVGLNQLVTELRPHATKDSEGAEIELGEVDVYTLDSSRMSNQDIEPVTVENPVLAATRAKKTPKEARHAERHMEATGTT